METRKDLEDSTDTVVDSKKPLAQKIAAFFLHWGIETHGISPTPIEDRVDKRLYQMFFVWFSANFNILGFSAGSAGPAFFKLGLRDSVVILLVADVIGCIVPALFAIFGPKLGTRAMVQARFSWGYFGSVIPSLLNVFSMQAFLVLNCIIGGQTLAGVSDRLSDTVGIVTISVLSLMLTIFGYKVVHWYESLVWVPNVIAFIVMLGVGYKHLYSSSLPLYPVPTTSTVLSFASFITASTVTWCTATPDYGVYHDSRTSSFRIFIYTYLGFFSSHIIGHILGAAFGAAAEVVPSWKSGFNNGNNIGGLISAILAPTGWFGKFQVVLLALSVPSACAPTMYSFGTSFMSIAPIFSRVPRYIFPIVSAAILIPIAIVGATKFYATLVDIIGGVGYWCTAFAAIILCEHFVFRRHDFQKYNIEDWDKPSQLPLGVAATLAFVGAFGIIVPSISQPWYIGPIADAGTGDIALLTGFSVSGVLYFILRPLERRWTTNKLV